jgi:hypothetical protein
MLTNSCLDKTREWNKMAVTFNLMLAITYGLMVKTPTDVGRVHKVILNLMKDFFAPFIQLHEKMVIKCIKS